MAVEVSTESRFEISHFEDEYEITIKMMKMIIKKMNILLRRWRRRLLRAPGPKFAGPCAQGVLDPVTSHFPSAVLNSIVLLEHPRGHGPRKCDPRRILGGSLADSRCGSRLFYTQKTSGFTLRFEFGPRANGPGPPIDRLHPPTYRFMVQFFTICSVFSYFFLKNVSCPRWGPHF